MNNIINKFLLARDTFMPEMNLRQPGFIYKLVCNSQKSKQEHKNSKKQEIPEISTGMNWRKFVFNLIQ